MTLRPSKFTLNHTASLTINRSARGVKMINMAWLKARLAADFKIASGGEKFVMCNFQLIQYK